MNYLLDTHTFLWALFSPGKLSNRSRKIIVDPANEILVSIITFWEISLKYNLGKLELSGITPEELPGISGDSGFALLQLDVNDVTSFHNLPRDIHGDPFDRLLIWQAARNNIPVISRDKRFGEHARHGLKVVW